MKRISAADVTRIGALVARDRGPVWVFALALASVTAIIATVAGPMPFLLLSCGLLVGYASAVWPGILFGAYLLIPFYKAAAQPFSPIDITVALALLNSLQIIPIIRDKRPLHISRAGVGLWIALTLLILAGVLWAPDQNTAIGTAAAWCALVVAPTIAATIRVGRDERYVRQVLWTFLGMGVLTIGVGLSALSSAERLAVLGQNTIQVGRAALLVPILGVTWIFRERRLRASVVIIPLIPAALVVALATGSRGPIVALIFLALLGLIALLTKPHAISWRLVGLVAAVTLASVVVASEVAPELPGQSIQRFAGLMDFLDGGLPGDSGAAAADTSAGRVTLYRLAVSMFQERPILGVGTSGFQALSPQLVGAAQADAYPHNALLQFAAEFGIVGLALFASLALLALTRPLPRGPDRSAVRVLLAFFVLNAMFSGDILQDRTLWGLLLLILMIGPRRGDEATNALRSDRSLVPGRERIDK